MRYQYDKYELFTIIYNKNYFLIRNNDHKIVNRIKNDELIDKISEILSHILILKILLKKMNILI